MTSKCRCTLLFHLNLRLLLIVSEYSYIPGFLVIIPVQAVILVQAVINIQAVTLITGCSLTVKL